MATTTFEVHTPVRGNWFIGLLHRTYKSLTAWQDRAKSRAQLELMSDYQLKDIGLTRGDAYREVHKGSWTF